LPTREASITQAAMARKNGSDMSVRVMAKPFVSCRKQLSVLLSCPSMPPAGLLSYIGQHLSEIKFPVTFFAAISNVSRLFALLNIFSQGG
jgi:hypothetical protein